tara:strand:- start:291 stop:452 length:162 start_codon:yes stop_codon:yes gene_type:complete
MKIEKVSINQGQNGEKQIFVEFRNKKVVESEHLEIESSEKLIIELKIEKTGEK